MAGTFRIASEMTALLMIHGRSISPLCSWLRHSSAQRPDVFEATLLASSFVISGHIGDSFLGRILPHLVVIGSLDCHGVSGESFLESQRLL